MINSPTHKNIYLLRDPDTLKVKYIGNTRYSLKERLKAHISETTSKTITNACKNVWIIRLLKAGKKPIIELIEEVEIHRASETERKWIKHYETNGDYLYNIIIQI